MVDEKPSSRIESTPDPNHNAHEIADRLRDGLTPNISPVDATATAPKNAPVDHDIQIIRTANKTNPAAGPADGQTTDSANAAAALGEMKALSVHPAGGNAIATRALQGKLLDDPEGSSFDKLVANNVTARRVVAYGEGLAYTFPGALKAVESDITHPGQLLEKGLTAATIGVGMRVLLPKTGAGKAIVGAIMGYYMVKDAVKPLVNGWEESGKAENMTQVNKAAQHIGDGLGAFAWDAYLGSKIGLKAEKLTGATLDAALGTAKYAAFEKFKVDVDNKFITKPLETVLSPINRYSNMAADKMVRKVEQPNIVFQDVKHRFAEVEAQNIARVRSVDLHLKGAVGADGGRLGFSETLDLLEKGHDPRNIKSTDVKNLLGLDIMDYPGNRVSGVNETISDALAKQGITASTVPLREAPRTNLAKGIIGPTDNSGGFTGGDGGKTPSDAAKLPGDATKTTGDATQAPGNATKAPGDAAKPPGDGAKLPSDAAKPPATSGDQVAGDKTTSSGNGAPPPPGKPYTTKGEQEVNAVNYGKLAGMNKTHMDAWDDKRVLIEDAKERLAGPVHAAVSPDYKPMDKGYLLVRNQMMQIGGQIASEDDLKYVMPLMSRLSMASTQHISDGLTNTASLKYQLDLMALETHSELVRNMKKAGIDPDAVLRSKNPAIFSISHDGGAGPHTMRQIDGVWNVDHVLYPRNMVDTRSTTTSGIYSHELGHDQYGGILKFDESIREQVITDAVAKGLGARANEKIHFPGVGDVTKQQLIEAIFKAQADENTADIWGAAWSGHNSGGALGLLLQSLRKGGQLETRNVFGAEFKADDNPFGFEAHAFDAIRPKIVAAVMKARANGDAKVIDYANALERYAGEASKAGDYVFANMDKPGETVTIPRKDMEDVIPHLIDAQLNTKLSALQGHSFSEILPDLPANLAKMDTLADLMVDAIKNNKKPNQIPFDVSQYSIIQVFGAGLPAASRLVAGGMDATEANAAVNVMSDYLRGLYHGNDPHVDPLKPSALQTIRLSSPKSLVAGTAQAGREIVHNTGKILSRTGQLSDWLAGRSTSWAGRVGAISADQTYKKALDSQKIAQIDMTPIVAAVPAMQAVPATAQAGGESWLKDRDQTRQNLTALEQAKTEVLKGGS